MNIPSRFQLAGTLVLVFCAVTTLAAERLGSTPRDGLLLLRNGEVLPGSIALVGEHYTIVQNGAEIRVKSADADFFCRDLDEAYERQRVRLTPGKALEHILLTEWCLRHGLNGYAATELSEAIALEPKHPKLPLLERRLRLAVSHPPAPVAASRPQTTLSNEELEQLAKSLPPGALETFTTTIQPMLLNHCATSGCHGPTAKDELRLSRAPSRQPLTRRQTQRNLASALKLLDQAQPDASPLLLMARQPHGTAKSEPLPDRETGPLRQLEYWIGRVARRQDLASPATITESSPLLQVRAPGGISGGGLQGNRAADHDESTLDVNSTDDEVALDEVAPADGKSDPEIEDPVPGDDSAEAADAASASQNPPAGPRPRGGKRKPPQRGRAIESFAPVDPFDPEIFNRRYRSRAEP